MSVLYNVGIKAFALGVRIAALRCEKAKKMLAGHAETFGYLESRRNSLEGCVWIHAASLGEFEQGRPLIERIRKDYPNERILLTFFSPSGYEIRKNYNMVDGVCYLPFDTQANAQRFIETVKPRMAVFVKYEFWSNYLHALKAHGVPAYSISSIFRPGQIFFRWWGGFYAKVLRCFDRLYVQNEESKALLAGIGISNVTVAGDTRFDRVTAIQASCKRFDILDEFSAASQKPILMMGSSWQPDEDIVVPYFNEHPEMRLVIAPHEFNEARLASLLQKINRPVKRYTKIATASEARDCDCLIIDCFGILSSCYAYAQAAYIGGGFGAGIHNLNEAAVYGIPVIFGPNHYKFKEASDLIACGGGFSIKDSEGFSEVFTRMLTDAEALKASGKRAGDYIKSQLGATEIIYHDLFPAK